MLILVGLLLEGVVLIVGIDRILDMQRGLAVAHPPGEGGRGGVDGAAERSRRPPRYQVEELLVLPPPLLEPLELYE